MWSSKPGSFMAAADQLNVRIVGAGTHGSTPYRGKDPIPVACEVVTALQTMITRQFDVFDPVVLTVGRIAGGTKENIIPDDAFFDATVRTFSEEARAKLQLTSTRLVESLGDGYPAVLVRIPDLAKLTKQELRDVVIDAWLTRAQKRVAKAWLAEHEPTDD